MSKKTDGLKRPVNRTDSAPPWGSRPYVVEKYYAAVEALIRPLIGTGISPNFISSLSLIAAAVSGYFYSRGAFFTGGMLLLFTGFLDTLDGTVARLSGKMTRFGALLDSTLDRYAEFFIFFGLLIFFREDPAFYIILAAVMGSVMVSYIKARSQSLGETRSVGLMQRPERLILLIAGSLLDYPVRTINPELGHGTLIAALALLAVSSNMTALRRLYQGKKDLK